MKFVCDDYTHDFRGYTSVYNPILNKVEHFRICGHCLYIEKIIERQMEESA